MNEPGNRRKEHGAGTRSQPLEFRFSRNWSFSESSRLEPDFFFCFERQFSQFRIEACEHSFIKHTYGVRTLVCFESKWSALVRSTQKHAREINGLCLFLMGASSQIIPCTAHLWTHLIAASFTCSSFSVAKAVMKFSTLTFKGWAKSAGKTRWNSHRREMPSKAIYYCAQFA